MSTFPVFIDNVNLNMLQEQYNLLQDVYNEGDNEFTGPQNMAIEGIMGLLDAIFIDALDIYPQASEPWLCEICGTKEEGDHLPECTSEMNSKKEIK